MSMRMLADGPAPVGPEDADAESPQPKHLTNAGGHDRDAMPRTSRRARALRSSGQAPGCSGPAPFPPEGARTERARRRRDRGVGA